METGNSPSQGAGQTRKGPVDTAPAGFVGVRPCAPVPPPPMEATSLERLFSMALALADKPYQLISPSRRQTASALANGTLVPLAACPAGQGSCAGRRSGKTQSSTARGRSSTGQSHTRLPDGPTARMPTAQFPDTGTQRPTAPLLCPQGHAATCTDSWKHPLPIASSTVTPISQMHTSNSSAPPSLPPECTGGSHSETATHNTQTRRDPQNRDYTPSIQDPQEEADSLSSADFPSTVLTSAHRYTRPLSPEDSHHRLPRKPPTQRCRLTRQLGHTSSLSAPLSTSQSFGGKALCLWAKGPQAHFHSPWAAGMGLQLLC